MAKAGTSYYLPKPELIGDELLKRIASIRRRFGQYDDYKMAAAVGLPLEDYIGRKAQAESKYTKDLKRWNIGSLNHKNPIT